MPIGGALFNSVTQPHQNYAKYHQKHSTAEDQDSTSSQPSSFFDPTMTNFSIIAQHANKRSVVHRLFIDAVKADHVLRKKQDYHFMYTATLMPNECIKGHYLSLHF